MKKYEAVIILNPNLSSKVDIFIKDFTKLLSDNSFKIFKSEDIGRKQLAYSINNHNKGHYLIFSIEGNSLELINIENKIKYDDSIVRHLFISVKEHNENNSSLFTESMKKQKEQNENYEEKVSNHNDDDLAKNNKISGSVTSEKELNSDKEEQVDDE